MRKHGAIFLSNHTLAATSTSFYIFQARSRAWRLNYLFQARFTPHWAKGKPSKQRYKTSTWCFQGSLPGNRLISGRQMERCLSVFKCHGVQLSSSMFYSQMRRLDLDRVHTHTLALSLLHTRTHMHAVAHITSGFLDFRTSLWQRRSPQLLS